MSIVRNVGDEFTVDGKTYLTVQAEEPDSCDGCAVRDIPFDLWRLADCERLGICLSRFLANGELVVRDSVIFKELKNS